MTADFWLRIVLASAIILAIWNSLAKGQLLEKVGDFLEDRWYGKPLGLCPPCAASVYGTGVWFLTGGRWTEWPIFILALSGVLVIVSRNLLR